MATPTKPIKASLRLQIQAGLANPAPPIGPALGSQGLNIREFCEQFNQRTSSQYDRGALVTAVILVYADRSFSFVVKTPTTTYLLRKHVLDGGKGSDTPHSKKVGRVTYEQLAEIAKIKQEDLSAADLTSAMRSIAGTARSMGIEVEENKGARA